MLFDPESQFQISIEGSTLVDSLHIRIERHAMPMKPEIESFTLARFEIDWARVYRIEGINEVEGIDER